MAGRVGGRGPDCARCGKVSFTSRKAARRAARDLFPETRMNAYPCRYNSTLWHFGHLPDAVRHGVIDRSIYRDHQR